MQAGLIDSNQFVEACTLWSTRKDTPLVRLLVDRGWISPADQDHLEYLLERNLQKLSGSPAAGLAAADDREKRCLATLADAQNRETMADLNRPEDQDLTVTIDLAPQRRERYSLTRLHATGGIGRVWVAHDPDLGRNVALKELRPERSLDTGLWPRFLREARVTGQLEHPGIVPVYELARRPSDRQPFYTMRFVKGKTLADVTREYHRKKAAGQSDSLSFLTLVNAFVAVCNTIAYAHSRGVIHRDLKGQNVVLGDFGEVMVLDWGLAKVMSQDDSAEPLIMPVNEVDSSSELTMQGQTVGTPAYMAPEQAAGRPAT
jgi:tRNA A-37 threonylcarbamoyl transferase component Bud32